MIHRQWCLRPPGVHPSWGSSSTAPPPRLGVPELEAALAGRQTHCAPRDDAVLHWIGEQKIPAVILAAHWMVYAATPSVATAAGSQLTLIDVGQPDQTDEAATFERSLAATLDALQRLHVRVFVVEDTPEQAFNVPYALAAEGAARASGAAGREQ
ncbi:MAG: SGNH hydrolase domain-containing protein [Aliidongia sp.]